MARAYSATRAECVEGVGRLGVDDQREGVGDAIEERVVGRDLEAGRDQRQQVAIEAGVGQAGPEAAIAGGRDERVDELGIEPAAAPLAGDVDGAVRPALRPEDLDDLRQADDPRQQRRLEPAQLVRIAAAVPVLVHRADRLDDGLGQADHARDLGAALAAHREDLGAAALGAADGELAELPHPRHQRAAAPDVRHRVRDLLGHPPPVAHPHGALDLVVAAAEQVADERGVGRAAGVLEEQRVEELGLQPGGKVQGAPEAQANQGGAGRVAARVALGQVQRVRQAFEDGRDPKGRPGGVPDGNRRSTHRTAPRRASRMPADARVPHACRRAPDRAAA